MAKATNEKRNKKELDTIFYQRYDENFLFNKVLAVYFVSKNGEAANNDFKTILSDWCLSAEAEYDWNSALRAEIYFTVFMQFEALFALLIAKFQDEPHWIYLTNYGTEEIKNKIRNFLDNNYSLLTNGKVKNREEFINHSVYENVFSSSEDDYSKAIWQLNIDNIDYILKQISKRYLENLKEYNGYKHGLRITRAKDVKFEIPGVPILNFPETIGFLDIKKDKGGKNITVEVLKAINPEQSFHELTLMWRILRIVKFTRLTKLTNGNPSFNPENFLFIDFDKGTLVEKVKFQTEFSV